MPIDIVDRQIEKAELSKWVIKGRFGSLVKAVVDIKRAVMIVGGGLHSDEEEVLLEQGSQQQDLWGINLYPEMSGEELIEFDSMINLRPSQGNDTRSVDDPVIRQKITEIVKALIKE